MKKLRRFFLVSFLVLAVFCLWRVSHQKGNLGGRLPTVTPSGTESERDSSSSETQLAASNKEPTSSPLTGHRPTTNASTPARAIIGSAWKKGQQPEIIAFAQWTDRFLEAADAQREELISEGVELAMQRRAILAQLIRSDPEQALAAAVPLAVRIQLPGEIVSSLEERVSGSGDLSLVAVTPAPAQHVSEPVFRTALVNGNEYRAFTYGRRKRLATLPDASIIGIALDRALAVSDSPLRVLESGETASGRQVQEVCVISGKVTPVSTDAPLNVAEPTAVEVSGQVQVLCETAHVVSYEDRLLAKESVNVVTAADGQPGSSGVSGRPLQAWTHGIKKVLIIRVDFSDLPGTPVNSDNQPITEDFAVNLINSANGVRDYYQQGSYGKSSLQIAPTTGGNSPDVTGVLRMPRTAVSYATNGDNGSLHVDARMAAQVLGFAVGTYDRIGVVFSYLGNIPGSQVDYAGLGEVIGKNFWINGYYDLRVVTHEIGHNYGLWHANLWRVSDGNPVSETGVNLEYGDDFDIMGGSGVFEGHFTHWNKSILQWIPDAAIPVITNSGTYRIYRFDHQNANLSNTLAIKIVRDGTRDYWIGYRRGTDNANLNNGAYVLWGYNTNQGGHLLDMTTPGMGIYDAALGIGAIFTDPVTNITVRPIATGGVSPNEFLDVQVFFGPVPILPPIVTVQPENLVLHVGENATFGATVLGSSPLSYQWRFNGSNITGATGQSYVRSNLQPAHVGDYTLVITNAAGAVTSSVAILALPPVPLPVAVDNVEVAWATGGNVLWGGVTNASRDGVDSAESGPVTENQESWLQTVITNGPGELNFWWKVSSESGVAYLEFYLDGQLQNGRISGEIDWRQMAFSLSGGNHVLRWRYTINPGGSVVGQNRGWLDQVSFVPRPLSLLVTSSNDSGPGSLRRAILDANAIGNGSITFSNMTGTIFLVSPLPEITANVNILGSGANTLAISGSSLCRVLWIGSNVTCLVSGLTIKDGAAPTCSDGGGIYNAGSLAVVDCCITNNQAVSCYWLESGGGIYSSGSLLLSNVVVAGNSSFHFGGGIYSEGTATIINSRITGNDCFEYVGGVAFSGQVLQIEGSTINSNSAGWSGGVSIGSGIGTIKDSTINDNSYGGGVINFGDLTMINCTVSRNKTKIDGGGGIKNYGTLTSVNCTIAFNREELSSLGGGIHNVGTYYALNTIIASNVVFDPSEPNAAPDYGGILNSQGFNLIANPINTTIVGNSTGNLYGLDPHLGDLENNGGRTLTHALLFQSPAIDNGAAASAPVTDQRGAVRPQGAGVDIGAYEFGYIPLLTGVSLSNSMIRFVLNGHAGYSYVIQISSNLVNWSAISTNTIPIGGSVLIFDPSMTNQPRRFYRAVPAPPSITLVGHIDNGGYARSVTAAGDYAYLANEMDGLRVYAVSNPAAPINIGYANTGDLAWGVAIAGNVAYLANFNSGLRTHSISNPANPTFLGQIDNGGQARGVVVSGSYAYLANGNDGLRIYNIANPAAPVSVSRTNNGGFALRVAVANNYAYLANDTDGLRVYNVSNPANPINVGHIDSGGKAIGLTVSGTYVYLANGTDGLRVYNVSNPASPVAIGHINNGGEATAVVVQENYAFLANQDDGLRIYDISNPASPVSVGHVDDGGTANDVAVSGNHVYLANYDDGLRIYLFLK